MAYIKMINFDDVTGEKTIEHNPNFCRISDFSYKISIIGGSGSGKTTSLLNSISHELDSEKIHLNAKDPYEAKYQLLINKHESVGLRHCEVFMEYSNNMDGICKIFDRYNPNENCKTSIVFDDMFDELLNNKKLQPIVTKLFIRSLKIKAYTYI